MYQDSPAESDHSGKHVWKDTSAEVLYGSYLDNNNNNFDATQQRMTFGGGGAGRMTATGFGAAGAQHPDITIGLLDENETKKKEYSGRKKVWPGALFLFIVTAGAIAAMTYFSLDMYDKAQTQQTLSEEINTPNVAKKSIPIKGVFFMRVYVVCLLSVYLPCRMSATIVKQSARCLTTSRTRASCTRPAAMTTRSTRCASRESTGAAWRTSRACRTASRPDRVTWYVTYIT